MLRFLIEIKMGTKAFDGIVEMPDGTPRFRQTLETARLLEAIKDKLETEGVAAVLGTLRDSNGKECGSVRLFDDDEELF